MQDQTFAVFCQDGAGPVWRGFFNDLDAAKQKAKQCVHEEGLEAFVFSFQSYTEVARFFPARAETG